MKILFVNPYTGATFVVNTQTAAERMAAHGWTQVEQ